MQKGYYPELSSNKHKTRHTLFHTKTTVLIIILDTKIIICFKQNCEFHFRIGA